MSKLNFIGSRGWTKHAGGSVEVQLLYTAFMSMCNLFLVLERLYEEN